MKRTFPFVLPLLALLIASCGGVGSRIVSGSVKSFSASDSIVEGEKLEVEVGVILTDSRYSFSHFDNEVNADQKTIRIRVFLRELLGGVTMPVVTTHREIASFEGLTPGEWTVVVEDTWPPELPNQQTVTVLPSP